MMVALVTGLAGTRSAERRGAILAEFRRRQLAGLPPPQIPHLQAAADISAKSSVLYHLWWLVKAGHLRHFGERGSRCQYSLAGPPIPPRAEWPLAEYVQGEPVTGVGFVGGRVQGYVRWDYA